MVTLPENRWGIAKILSHPWVKSANKPPGPEGSSAPSTRARARAARRQDISAAPYALQGTTRKRTLKTQAGDKTPDHEAESPSPADEPALLLPTLKPLLKTIQARPAAPAPDMAILTAPPPSAVKPLSSPPIVPPTVPTVPHPPVDAETTTFVDSPAAIRSAIPSPHPIFVKPVDPPAVIKPAPPIFAKPAGPSPRIFAKPVDPPAVVKPAAPMFVKPAAFAHTGPFRTPAGFKPGVYASGPLAARPVAQAATPVVNNNGQFNIFARRASPFPLLNTPRPAPNARGGALGTNHLPPRHDIPAIVAPKRTGHRRFVSPPRRPCPALDRPPQTEATNPSPPVPVNPQSVPAVTIHFVVWMILAVIVWLLIVWVLNQDLPAL